MGQWYFEPNWTQKLNFGVKKYNTKEEGGLIEAYLIELSMEKLMKEKVKDNFSKFGEAISNEQIEVWRINEEIQPLKVKTMKHGMHNNSKTMKKKLKEWHD